MKKTVSVSIDEGVLKLAKEASWDGRISLSRFIEGAIRSRVEGVSVGNYPHKDIVVGVPVEKELKSDVRKHTPEIVNESPQEKYRRLNPMKRCVVCHKLNRDCGCEK